MVRVTFEQRFASACLLLLAVVLVYAMFTGQLDITLAITSLTGLIATLIAGKSLLDQVRKPNQETKNDS